MRYARLTNGVVAEILAPPGDLADYYSPEFIAGLVDLPAEAGLGWIYDGETFAPPPQPAVPSLADTQAALCAFVDAAAERERQRWITPGAGQAMTYLAKAQEAQALAADVSPVAESYPLLSAEIGITGATLPEVGATVLAAYQSWLTRGAAIEAARLGAKAAINAATDIPAAAAVVESIVWPA